MYTTTTVDIPGGRQYGILEDGSPVSFRRFLELLETDNVFGHWYAETLAAFDAEAFYWELPPLTTETVDRDAEFVLIEAPMLARFPPEPAPFSSYFDRAPDEDVIVFPNLGGDAVMVVPCPRGPDEHYPHLAAFLRGADRQQVRALWRVTAQEMLRRVGTRPTWLSTAGGGVAWLHIRLDSRPKYYSYEPYRRTAPAA
jgi:hypothetical protein